MMFRQHIKNDFPQLDAAVKALKKNRTRLPYVVEFAGLPKAGKSTILRRTYNALDRLGLQCAVVTEAATVRIPSEMRKDHFMFNMLCFLDNLTNLLIESQKKGSVDILLLDRGIIDSKVWFEFLVKTGELPIAHKDPIDRFLQLDTWFHLTNLLVFVDNDWSTYRKRFDLDRPVEQETTICEDHFRILNECYSNTLRDLKNSDYFNRLDLSGCLPSNQDDGTIATPDVLLGNYTQASEGSIRVVNKILDQIPSTNIEYIATIPSDSVNESLIKNINSDRFNLDGFIDQIFPRGRTPSQRRKYTSQAANYNERDATEDDPSLLQIVAGAFVRYGDAFLVLRHSAEEERDQLRGKLTLLVTGHVDSTDTKLAQGKSNELEHCVRRELKEELTHIDMPSLVPRFVLRMGDDKMGKRHLGIIYEVETYSSNVNISTLPGAGAFDLDPKFWSIDEIKKHINDFNEWSKTVIRNM